jgi:hypothetical protein
VILFVLTTLCFFGTLWCAWDTALSRRRAEVAAQRALDAASRAEAAARAAHKEQQRDA